MMYPKTTSAIECSKLNITGLPVVKVRMRFLYTTSSFVLLHFTELFSVNELSQCVGSTGERF